MDCHSNQADNCRWLVDPPHDNEHLHHMARVGRDSRQPLVVLVVVPVGRAQMDYPACRWGSDTWPHADAPHKRLHSHRCLDKDQRSGCVRRPCPWDIQCSAHTLDDNPHMDRLGRVAGNCKCRQSTEHWHHKAMADKDRRLQVEEKVLA